ncbi:MAG: hypothetical protein JWO30_3332 [Fibrobacteres bacterium]|nr:hypothetical protein [Fibrobacterota bacterium]
MRSLPILFFSASLVWGSPPAPAGHMEKDQGKTAPAVEAPPEKEKKEPDAKENETKPGMVPKPDTAFARAVDWNDGTAEVLTYSVRRSGKTGESECRGKLVTERMFLRSNGLADRKSTGKDELEILNALVSVSGEEDGIPFSSETAIKMPRKEAFRLLRQDQSLQSWPGVSHRSLDCRVTPPRLRIVSSGGESALDTVLSRWPVYTEEMLFVYLRALPQRAGYREEVWLQDWGGEGKMTTRPRFATISVRSRTTAIRDMDTWYVTVDRENGRRSEFWISASGLHPIVLAILADGATWTLQDIARKKYWTW